MADGGKISSIPRAWARPLFHIPADLKALETLANQTKAKLNSLLAKLDADAGVTDVNYAATLTVATADVVVKTK